MAIYIIRLDSLLKVRESVCLSVCESVWYYHSDRHSCQLIWIAHQQSSPTSETVLGSAVSATEEDMRPSCMQTALMSDSRDSSIHADYSGSGIQNSEIQKLQVGSEVSCQKFRSVSESSHVPSVSQSVSQSNKLCQAAKHRIITNH